MGKISKFTINEYSVEEKQVKKALSDYIIEDKIDDNHIIIRNDKDFSMWAVIDSNENILIPYQSGRISKIENSNYLISQENNKYGVINLDGKIIIPKEYNSIKLFNNCFIVEKEIYSYSSKKKCEYGILDINNKSLVQVNYKSIEYIGKGLFRLIKNSDRDYYDDYEDDYNNEKSLDGRISLFFSKQKKIVNIPGENIKIIKNSSILSSPRELDEYEFYPQGYMLLSIDGKILSPENTTRIYNFDEKGYAKIEIRKEYPFPLYKGPTHYKGTIKYNGELCIRKGESFVSMPKRFDWVTDYKDGIANYYLNDFVGHVNVNEEIVVKINLNGKSFYIPLPKEYDLGYDSNNEFIQVEKDGLMGIINSTGKEIIPPKFYHINVILDYKKNITRFVCFLKGKSYLKEIDYEEFYCGLADLFDEKGIKLNDEPLDSPEYIGYGIFKVKSEEEKIKRLRPNWKGEFDTVNLQLIGRDGKLIENDKFSSVSSFNRHIEYDDGTETIDEYNDYAIFTIADTWGAIDNNGNIIVKDIEHAISPQDVTTFLLKDKIKPELYKINEILVPFNHNYSFIKYVGYGLFLVKRLIKINGEEVEGSTYVDVFNRPLTPMSGGVSEIKNKVFISYVEGNGKYLQGIFDINGNVIIPYCNYDFKFYNNFILAKSRDYKPIIYSYIGEMIFPKDMFQNGDNFEDFLDYFIKVKRYYRDYDDLYNLQGKLIYEGESNCYTDYESVIPGILKIKKYYGDDRYYCLGDYYGNIKSKSYEKIDIYNNGLCRVSETKHIGYSDYDGRKLYRTLYGVINLFGDKITPIIYESLEIFENENIITTSKGNLTYEGRFIAFYENENGIHNLILDKKYDYCLSFENGYAIVFSEELCGIINEEGKEIFPVKCSKIERISKDIVKFKINKLWGLFDINMGIIISNKYSSIGEFKNGYAVVSYSPMYNVQYYGIVSLEKEIIEPIYSNLLRYNERIVAYSTGIAGKWNIFNLENNEATIIDESIKFLGNLSEDLIRFNKDGTVQRNKYGTYIQGGKWGFMKINGKVTIDASFDMALDFHHNLSPVKKGSKWGFIDLEGNLVVPFEYEEVVKKEYEYSAIKVIDDDKHWFKFNDKGRIIEQGIEEPEIEDDYDSGWDDSPSIYDNPYYNDNLDMDQQSIDFWNNL